MRTRRSRKVALAGALVALAATGSAVPAQATVGSPCQVSGQQATCSYASTGGEQSFLVPNGVTSVNVMATGAKGAGGNGGAGGTASATLAVTAGSTLYVEVGGAGEESTEPAFNGGGRGAGGQGGFGGGGASDVRTVSCGLPCDPLETASLASRAVVAGGGGGGNSGAGGAAGSAGARGDSDGGAGGQAGTAGGGGAGGSGGPGNAGGGAGGQDGSLGSGGDGGLYYSGGGGGGGGGLYGGGGGGGGGLSVDENTHFPSTNGAGGGGGGSSYAPGGSVGVASTSAPAFVTITYTIPPRPSTTGVSCSPSSIPAGDTTSCTATVSDPNGGTPTGTVSFSSVAGGSFSPANTCTLANGACSVTYTAGGAGGDSVTAQYGGDAAFATSSQSTGVSVTKRITTMTTTVIDDDDGQAWAGTETAPAHVRDTASLGGTVAAIAPTGTVTYALYGTSQCSGDTLASDVVTLSGGTVPASPVRTLGAGQYGYRATYGGDGNHTAVIGDCEPFTVLPSRDAVNGSGVNAPPKGKPNRFDFAAFSDPNGEHAGGTIDFASTTNARLIHGTVVCLTVAGDKAAIVYAVDPPPPPGVKIVGGIIKVQNGSPDRLQNSRITEKLLTRYRAKCPGMGNTTLYPIASGGISVDDA